MIKNYFITAIRNLIKQRYFTSINIFGLAFGIAASVLIFLWVNNETSYDRFHVNCTNIHRLTADAAIGGQRFNICFAPSPAAKELADKCPEVEMATRTTGYFDIVFKYNENFYKEKKVISADSVFFKMFSFPFIEGNPQNPYTSQNSVVMTRSTAKKYFGDEKALGKVIFSNGTDPLTVSAVVEDIPSNSHMKFNMAIYLSREDNWGNFNRITYVLLKDDFSRTNLEKSIDEMEEIIVNQLTTGFGMTSDQFRSSGNYLKMGIQPLKSIHLESKLYGELEPAGSKTMVIFFSIIAILILLIASINYMNLSTAYYDNRRLEVGIRKANGATKGRLIMQFLSESIIISLAAFVLGIILIKLFTPVFNNSLNINIEEGIYSQWYFSLLVLAMVIVLGFISGIYPATYLSRFNTIPSQQKMLNSSISKSLNIRTVLVVFQFTITIIVISSTFLIKKQVDFLLNKELGFNEEKLVVIEGANGLGENKDIFENELKQNPLIKNLSYSDVHPGANYQNITGYNVEGYPADQQFVLKTIQADDGYFETYEMEIVQGRNFSETDNICIILNEKAVDLLKLNEPINTNINSNGQFYPVIGVVKNFFHDPLNVTLDPIIIIKNPNRYYNYLTIRLSEGNTKDAINYINKKWDEYSGNKPFEYFFLDNKIESAYKNEIRAGNVFTAFSILSVIIACMGLFGIASFIIQRRVKEIGIRKVNGAMISEILGFICTDFIKWVIIAFVIATPIAWFAMNKWLGNFAYKTGLSWWIFAISGLIALIIALLTVSILSWKASTRNPVESLRNE